MHLRCFAHVSQRLIFRLLRNRVSAQQARERKKAYLQNLERQSKLQQARNAELEDRNRTLEMEVSTLRALLNSYMGSSGLSGNMDEIVSEVTGIVTKRMADFYQTRQDQMRTANGGNHQDDDEDEEDEDDEEDDDDDDDEND